MANKRNSDQISLAEDAAGSSTDVLGQIDAASHHALSAYTLLDDKCIPVNLALCEALKHLKIAQEQQLLFVKQKSEREALLWNVPPTARTCSSVGREPDNPTAWGAECSTLSGTGAWGPDNASLEWLQLDLEEPGLVGGVITKGKTYTWCDGTTYDGWVSSFKVVYLVDPADVGNADASGTWEYAEGGSTFAGNEDAANEVVIFFKQPVFTKSVRIEIHDWSRPGGTVLKVDLLRHEAIALSLTATLVDACSVKIAVTNMGGESICTLESNASAPSEFLWSALSEKMGKPRRWLKLMLPDATLLSEDESRGETLAQVLKV